MGTYGAHGDEMDEWIENMGPEPVHVRSKAEHRRLMKERGLEQVVRHVPHPKGPRFNHTTDWTARMDPYTAKNVKELLERAFMNPKVTRPERPVMVKDVHELTDQEYGQYVDGSRNRK
jgi:hypothetical protein